MEKLVRRSEVAVEETWNLKDLYADEAEMEKDLSRLPEMARAIAAEYEGKLNRAETIAECLRKYQEAELIAQTLGNYAELATSVDYQDRHLRELGAKVGLALDEYSAALSFIKVELGSQPAEVLTRAAALEKGCAGFLGRIMEDQPHMLSGETEKALAMLGQTLGAPYEIYNVAKLGDMAFPDFEVEGKSYPLGYSLFEDHYEYEPDTKVRRAAFSAFSAKLKDYLYVTAAAYNAHVQAEKTMANLRGFSNVYDYLLQGQRVTRELYDRQIDVIMERLAPHMRKYAALLQKVHHLDKMTYADLKLPVDPDYSPKVTYGEARDYVEKGLSVMGEDYVKMLGEAFENRWIDYARNIGKSTGGFCASPYGSHSYILLNWNGKMSDVFTLAHELGHAGHFKLCNEAQSIFDVDVSTYFVEAPSTMNEILMSHYLLKTNEDPRFRRWVLSNMIGNTYYHNFVTHLLEAAYQREVYKIVDEGGSVQADTLNGIMRVVLEKFWGQEVELTEGAELTWMRQPHYYMGLYSYTYSAGLTIATQVAERIEREGTPAVEAWKKVLAAGSTLNPVEFAAQAGVDITTEEALNRTIDTIGSMIDEICRLSEEI